jgi:hypothetical protein
MKLFTYFGGLSNYSVLLAMIDGFGHFAFGFD